MEQSVRLNKAAKIFNVGVITIVDYLKMKGLEIDSNPNTRLSPKQYELLVEEFNNNSTSSKSEETDYTSNKDKYNSLKIHGRIDLSAFEDRKENRKRFHKQAQSSIKLIGIVKFFDHFKGFGFIVTNGCNIKDNNKIENKLFDFYINSNSCYNIEPNDNDWVVFDYKGERAINVNNLDFNKETLSIALQYRGEFAQIKGKDSHQEKKYNHSILSHIVKHYGNDKSTEIVEVFCDFLSTFSDEQVDSIILQFLEDKELVKYLFIRLYQAKDYFQDNKYSHLFAKLLNSLFGVIKSNIDLLIELPLNYYKDKLTEIETINVIKNKVQNALSKNFDTVTLLHILKELKNYEENKNDEITNAVLAQLPDEESLKTKFLLYKNDCINIFDENFIIYYQDNFSVEEIRTLILSNTLLCEQKQEISVSYMKYLYANRDINAMLQIKQLLKEHFTDNYPNFENDWTANLSEEEKYRLWTDEREIIENDYSYYLFDNLLNDDLRDYDTLFKIKRLTKKRIIEGLLNNLRTVKEINNLPTFNKVYFHIYNLMKVDEKCVDVVIDLQNSVFNVILWHFDKTESFDFETLRTKFIYFKPSDQVRIVKKLFMLAESKKISLDIAMLDSLVRVDRSLFEIIAKEKPEIPIDISVDVVIKSLCKYVKAHKFFYNNEIFDIVLLNMEKYKKYDFRIKDFFDECIGRLDCREKTTNIPYITGKITTRNNSYEITIYSYKEIDQQNGFFQRIKDEVSRKLHNRVWNNELKVWQAPIEDCNTNEIKRIAKTYNMQIEGDNEIVKQQLNDIPLEYEYVAYDKPNNVCYCEGRQNDTLWKNGEKFYWCRNSKCFKNALKNHSSSEWENYTMFDFLRILGINTDSVDKKQSIVENGDYIAFISIINRINELLEHLKCRNKKCGELLEPVEITDYSSQLVTHFKCTNIKCPEYGNVYYIHNCFNWKCKSIIDQRDTTKCPNGWYICKECGSCCSTANTEKMIKKQQERNNNTPSNKLLHFVQKKLGHFENNKIYCYKCGNLTQNCYCNNCKTSRYKKQ